MTLPSRHHGALATLLLAAVLTAAPAVAGQTSDERPEGFFSPPAPDALVLSTGSSRGLAHAGALLGLERRGYEPELVIGTSMGAVIGALYASGYSAEQIWDLALHTSWGDLFMASPVVAGPDQELLFPGVTVGLDLGTLEVSSGFIPEWRVNRFLTRLLFDANARARSDFDRLPRRFRSVTADLADGGEVVLARGDLARAVRASMGTPAFFSATRWGERLLVDGGIADYLPVSVARKLGAGRVIAVDVSRAPAEVRRTDPTALGGRSIALLMRNALPDTTPPDVLLRPQLDPDFPGAVFPERPRFLLDLGLDAAREADVAPTLHPQPRVFAAPPTTLAALEVEGTDGALEEFARHAFASAIGPYRPAAVLRAADRLYGTGLFHGVWPRVEKRGADSADVLVVALDARPRMALNAAAGYENDRGGRLWSVLDWRASALGDPLEARLGGGTDGLERWFDGSLLLHSAAMPGVAWSAGLHRRQVTVPFFDSLDSRPQVRHTGGWLGARYRHADLIASVAAQAEWLDVETGASGASWGGVARISSTISPAIMVGVPSELMVEGRTGVLDYGVVAARRALFRSAGSLQLAALIDGAWAFGEPPLDELPTLGERRGMPGHRWGQERGRARLLAGVDAAWPMLGSGWGRLRLRAGAAPDTASELRDHELWLAGAGLEGVWSTPFGPVLVGWGVNTRGSHRIDVGLGGAF